MAFISLMNSMKEFPNLLVKSDKWLANQENLLSSTINEKLEELRAVRIVREFKEELSSRNLFTIYKCDGSVEEILVSNIIPDDISDANLRMLFDDLT